MTQSRLALLAVAVSLLSGGLAACSQQTPTVNALDTGITSSNGGGQRALGNIPNVGRTVPAQ